jgi:hypothetical protein
MEDLLDLDEEWRRNSAFSVRTDAGGSGRFQRVGRSGRAGLAVPRRLGPACRGLGAAGGGVGAAASSAPPPEARDSAAVRALCFI